MQVLEGLWPQGCLGSGGEKESAEGGFWSGPGLLSPTGEFPSGCVGSRPLARLSLVISVLRSKCPLGLCFLCNILDFDTRCQTVSL